MSHVTLGLCTILHGFTHAYGTMLVPLYLLMVADLGLSGVGKASLIVTVYGLVYCLGSYAAGVMADRFNRKMLLGVGLIGNGLAIAAMGLTRQYEVLIALGVLGGLFGTLFHPAANALAPAHYPKSPGMAIGLLGIGSGLGFFAGPQYAGWRAEHGGWLWGAMADWQRPLVELGAIGAVFGILFLLFAREVGRAGGKHPNSSARPNGNGSPPRAVLPARLETEELVFEYEPRPQRVHLSRAMHRRVAGVAAAPGCRDFAGVASLTIASIYLQKAHGYTAAQAGFTIGAMMLISIVVNPLAVWLSPGRRRLPTLAIVLIAGGVALVTTPWWPVAMALPVLCVFQTFQLGSYAVSDAAMLERVPAEVRGRVVGLFLTLAGTFASLSPWAMGFWVDLLGDRATEPLAYAPIFGLLAAMMVVAVSSCPLIARLGDIERKDASIRAPEPAL